VDSAAAVLAGAAVADLGAAGVVAQAGEALAAADSEAGTVAAATADIQGFS
jgi:hypothetical protein